MYISKNNTDELRRIRKERINATARVLMIQMGSDGLCVSLKTCEKAVVYGLFAIRNEMSNHLCPSCGKDSLVPYFGIIDQNDIPVHICENCWRLC